MTCVLNEPGLEAGTGSREAGTEKETFHGNGSLASVRDRGSLGAVPQSRRHPERGESTVRGVHRPTGRGEHAGPSLVGAVSRYARDEGRSRHAHGAARGT